MVTCYICWTWQYVNKCKLPGQHYNDMVIGPHNVAFIQRNSGNDTFMNGNMCTNPIKDVNTALKVILKTSPLHLYRIPCQLHNNILTRSGAVGTR